MQHNTLADALSAIKNARRVGKQEVVIRPASKLIQEVLKVMQKEKYVGDFECVENSRGGEFKVQVNKEINNCNIITPRVYIKNKEYLKWEKRFLPAQGVGVLILSTSQGVLSHVDAKDKGIGGALLAYVY
jgi:small subunit ribosomal protein S8